VGAATLIRELQRAGYQVAALEQAARARPYRTFTPRGELAIVVGGEVEGLPLAVLRAADAILEIPMHGKKESLNVAVAFGIIAFHSRQHE
jgi:tRNA G18 (ribose-2'-O)-methylase SpoU